MAAYSCKAALELGRLGKGLPAPERIDFHRWTFESVLEAWRRGVHSRIQTPKDGATMAAALAQEINPVERFALAAKMGWDKLPVPQPGDPFGDSGECSSRRLPSYREYLGFLGEECPPP